MSDIVHVVKYFKKFTLYGILHLMEINGKLFLCLITFSNVICYVLLHFLTYLLCLISFSNVFVVSY